jgi:hypothetical protein
MVCLQAYMPLSQAVLSAAQHCQYIFLNWKHGAILTKNIVNIKLHFLWIAAQPSLSFGHMSLAHCRVGCPWVAR